MHNLQIMQVWKQNKRVYALNYKILTSDAWRRRPLAYKYYLYEIVARTKKFKFVNFVAYHILDLMHDTFLDLDLVHNTFMNLNMELVHNTSPVVVQDRGDASKECSQCLKKVRGLKDD